ncbi:MAG: peptidyl-alpha-hydroxyglycine alpha-amidating lyase family protein [Chloroflexota bacterium]
MTDTHTSTIRTDQGGLAFQVIPAWEKRPDGMVHLDVPGVAVDSADRVYLFTRYDPRVMVYEADGTFVTSWGEDLFSPKTHGITIGPDDMVYCTSHGDHVIRKFTLEGRLISTMGTEGVPSDTGYDGSNLDTVVRAAGPFNTCTNLAIAPDGELYVSDGYGNCRVHRFTAEGELIQSWGAPGVGPGEFHLPHGIWIDSEGRVLVADRENERIQIFSPDGVFIEAWTDVQRPCAITIDPSGFVYVAELRSDPGWRSYTIGTITQARPGRVSVFDLQGRLQARWGGEDMAAPGNFVAPHGITVDSRGNVYVAEVTHTMGGRTGLVPEGTHDIQKFTRGEGAPSGK